MFFDTHPDHIHIASLLVYFGEVIYSADMDESVREQLFEYWNEVFRLLVLEA